MDYIAWAELRTAHKVKVFRCDRGGEFLSAELQSALKKKGIEVELTASHSPHQNGVAERRNRVDMEITRCLLFRHNLHRKFWAEANRFATYLINRLPSTSTPNTTPYTLFYKKKPSLLDIGVFGCAADVIKEGHLKKLEPRTYKAIYLGPAYDGAGSRFYNEATNKVVVSRNYKLLDRVTSATPPPSTNPTKPILQSTPTKEEKGASSEVGDKKVAESPATGTQLYLKHSLKHTKHTPIVNNGDPNI